MASKILLLGGGGNCKSVIDVILEDNLYAQIGIVDKHPVELFFNTDRIFYSGNDSQLSDLLKQGWKEAFVTVGSVGDVCLRKALFERLKSIGFIVPNIVSSKAQVSKNAKFGIGTFVGKGAIVNAGASVGDCCIVNTGSIIEHDCTIGDFAHIAPGAILLGGVRVGNETHIGSGSVIKQYLSIGEKTIVGMGSVVTNNLESNGVFYGNPCQFVRKK